MTNFEREIKKLQINLIELNNVIKHESEKLSRLSKSEKKLAKKEDLITRSLRKYPQRRFEEHPKSCRRLFEKEELSEVVDFSGCKNDFVTLTKKMVNDVVKTVNSPSKHCEILDQDQKTFISNIYEEAIQSLHPSSLPKDIPCRSQEMQTIKKFINNNLISGSGGVMYVSGVPGTGKTAVVKQCLSELPAKLDKNTHVILKIMVNGMKLRRAQDIYTILYKKIDTILPLSQIFRDETLNDSSNFFTTKFTTRSCTTPDNARFRLDALFRGELTQKLASFGKDFVSISETNLKKSISDDEGSDTFQPRENGENNFFDMTNSPARPKRIKNKEKKVNTPSKSTLKSQPHLKQQQLPKLSVILFVDELDLICKTKAHQAIIYNLFDWPFALQSSDDGAEYLNFAETHTYNARNNNPTPNLIVLTVANTMDLPEKHFSARVQSRLGLNRLTFQPYNHTQLQEIISSRLSKCTCSIQQPTNVLSEIGNIKNTPKTPNKRKIKTKKTNDISKPSITIMNPDCIQLIARKVAALTGDARKALEICRRTLELCRQNQLTPSESKDKVDGTTPFRTIGMEDVQMAFSEIQETNRIAQIIISHLSLYEKLFLKILAIETHDKNEPFSRINNILERVNGQCEMDGRPTLNYTQCLRLCQSLMQHNIVQVEKARLFKPITPFNQRVRLNIFLLPAEIKIGEKE